MDGGELKLNASEGVGEMGYEYAAHFIASPCYLHCFSLPGQQRGTQLTWNNDSSFKLHGARKQGTVYI